MEAWAQAADANGPEGAVTLGADKIIKLRTATRRTSQLANQLLALSRADTLTVAAQPMQRVDLKELCEAVLPLYLDAATDKGMDLGLEAAPAEVDAHEWLLREFLGDLVDNAVKYTPRGGTVTIRCGGLTGNREGAFLEVEDDGAGIPPAERGKVLERFYRVPGTSGEGNGLGLAIAGEIARVHRSPLEMDYAATGPDGGFGLRVRLNLYLTLSA